MSDSTPEHRAVPEVAEFPELPELAPIIGTVEHTLESYLTGSAQGPFRKLIIQLLAPLATLLIVALSGHVEVVPLLTAAAGVLTAIAVYQLPDSSATWTTAKAIAAFASAVVQGLVVLLVGGLAFGEITPIEWVGVIVQALAAIGVSVIPNDALPATGEQLDAGNPPALPAASR